MSKKTIYFLCTGNSCRSQMAEGLLRHRAGDHFDQPVGEGLFGGRRRRCRLRLQGEGRGGAHRFVSLFRLKVQAAGSCGSRMLTCSISCSSAAMARVVAWILTKLSGVRLNADPSTLLPFAPAFERALESRYCRVEIGGRTGRRRTPVCTVGRGAGALRRERGAEAPCLAEDSRAFRLSPARRPI